MSARIMIIDDASSIRQAVGFTLTDSGYEVIEASNGREALEKLDGNSIALFICDVNMPVMDGISFLKTLKSDAQYNEYKFSPIIMLTTEAGEDKKIEGRDAGARAWMVKPFNPEQLISAVRKLIL